jgi:hypothetical protein
LAEGQSSQEHGDLFPPLRSAHPRLPHDGTSGSKKARSYVFRSGP